MIIGYHASHEQHSPRTLIELVKAAEESGFDAIMSSDHHAPWSEGQGHSGHTWAWLGAAMAATRLPFGSMAIPGGWRYHPAVLAQAVATLCDMFPGRLRWIAVGSGEALNETIVGEGWPDKDERNARLKQGTQMMQSLFAGETVSHEGPGLRAENARLWSLPEKLPALYGAALTEETAGWQGSWTDGLLTVRMDRAKLTEMARRYHSADPARRKPLALQLQLSWGQTRDAARTSAHERWRSAALPANALPNLRRPREFDDAAASIRLEEMDDAILLVSRPDDILDVIEDARAAGFEEVYVHDVAADQPAFLKFMQTQVLPACR
jgi:probable non-F420 flavinoid oxidoreductase